MFLFISGWLGGLSLSPLLNDMTGQFDGCHGGDGGGHKGMLEGVCWLEFTWP